MHGRLEGDNISMRVVMAPLWAVDIVLILAPLALAIAMAIRKIRLGETVEPILVRQREWVHDLGFSFNRRSADIGRF